MRRLSILIALFLALQPALAATLEPAPSGAPEAVLKWMKGYRAKPTPAAVPALVQALSAHGTIKEPESSGVYLGFYAGVLGGNPKKAWTLIEKTLPLPFEDQWIVIRGLAYSGLPNWKDLMRALALRVPERQFMAQKYIDGDLPALNRVSLEPAAQDGRLKRFFTGQWGGGEPPKREITFQSSPELIDALWGIYYASGSEGAIAQIVALLPWSKDRDNVEKLTIGSMAKFTLASNAARDAELLGLLKRLAGKQSDAVKPALAEVIEAAELVDTGRLGKEALAALEELKKKGPGSTRDLMTWGAAGEAAISVSCLGLAVGGAVVAGIPCVIGGALTTGAVRYMGGSGN